MPRLFAELDLARGDGRYARLLAKLAKVNVFILDDFGPEPLLPDHRRDLLEIAEDRYGRGSFIITSQVPVDHGIEVIGDPTLADAILDRIIHAAYRIELDGDIHAQAREPLGMTVESASDRPRLPLALPRGALRQISRRSRRTPWGPPVESGDDRTRPLESRLRGRGLLTE